MTFSDFTFLSTQIRVQFQKIENDIASVLVLSSTDPTDPQLGHAGKKDHILNNICVSLHQVHRCSRLLLGIHAQKNLWITQKSDIDTNDLCSARSKTYFSDFKQFYGIAGLFKWCGLRNFKKEEKIIVYDKYLNVLNTRHQLLYSVHFALLQLMRLENVGFRSLASWNTDSSTILTLLKGLSNEIFAACFSVDLHFLWSLFRIKAIKKTTESKKSSLVTPFLRESKS